MAFLVKVPWSIVSVVSQLFRANQMGFEQVFDNLTFKSMTAFRKRFNMSSNIIQTPVFGYLQS